MQAKTLLPAVMRTKRLFWQSCKQTLLPVVMQAKTLLPAVMQANTLLTKTVNNLSSDFNYHFFLLLTDDCLSTSSALLENLFHSKNSPSIKPTSIWHKTITFFSLEW